jgi:hypothetical protein
MINAFGVWPNRKTDLWLKQESSIGHVMRMANARSSRVRSSWLHLFERLALVEMTTSRSWLRFSNPMGLSDRLNTTCDRDESPDGLGLGSST